MRLRTRNALATLAGLALLASGPLAAQDVPNPAPEFGRYLPLYPGQYLDVQVIRDPRDELFAADGRRIDTASPAVTDRPGNTEMPRTDLIATLTWHFPFFEDYQIPFISSRTWLASVRIGYADMDTTGGLNAFINDDSDDEGTDADDLRNNGAGVRDLEFTFGTFLLGSENWRTRERTDFALRTTIGMRWNTGQYDRDAPTSAGSNAIAFDLGLAAHWQPLTRTFVDAGARLREYIKNQDPAFGALAPTQQGDDLFLDVSLAHLFPNGLAVTAFGTHRDGDPNAYTNVRFAPNPPEPGTGGDNYPTPGTYFDDGTELTTVGLGLTWFATQDLTLGLHWTHPTSGRSGEFTLPYTDRQPAGCTPGSVGCTTTEGETIVTDGYGPGRVFASDRFALSLTYHFGEGDTFTCVGCEE